MHGLHKTKGGGKTKLFVSVKSKPLVSGFNNPGALCRKLNLMPERKSKEGFKESLVCFLFCFEESQEGGSLFMVWIVIVLIQ